MLTAEQVEPSKKIKETKKDKIIRINPTETEAPENFSMVIGDVYRSSFPRPENFEFLKKLKLKSIL